MLGIDSAAIHEVRLYSLSKNGVKRLQLSDTQMHPSYRHSDHMLKSFKRIFYCSCFFKIYRSEGKYVDNTLSGALRLEHPNWQRHMRYASTLQEVLGESFDHILEHTLLLVHGFLINASESSMIAYFCVFKKVFFLCRQFDVQLIIF